MNNIHEIQIEAIKSQQLINEQARRSRQALVRTLALLAGQHLLRSSGKKRASIMRYAIGGGLLYLGLTGDVPLVSWLKRKNINHGQLNFKKEAIIEAPLDAVYDLFSNFSVIIQQIPGVKRVKSLDVEGAHWEVMLDVMGMDYVFELFIVKERENEFIGWSTGENSVVYHSGKIDFAPGPIPNLTKLNVVVSYTPPFGKIGRTVASSFNALFDYGISLFVKRLKRLAESYAI